MGRMVSIEREKVCPDCDGSGEVHFNPSQIGDPQMEVSEPCTTCAGSGEVKVSEEAWICSSPGRNGCQECEACEDWADRALDAQRDGSEL